MAPEPDRYVAPLLQSGEAATRPNCISVEAAAEAIAGAGQLITRLSNDAELVALLKSTGFTAAVLEAGIALLTAAEEQFNSCECSLAGCEAVRRERDSVWMSAREEYLDFRETVRLECHEASVRDRVLVAAAMSDMVPGFVAQAATSYEAIVSAGLTAVMAERGFGGGRLNEAVELLRHLTELDGLAATAALRLRRLSEEREVAIGMLNLWVAELLQTVRSALGETNRPPGGVGSRADAGIQAPRRVTRVPDNRRRPRPPRAAGE